MLTSGELYIRNITKSDAGSYKCQVRYTLSQTKAIISSKIGGKLILSGYDNTNDNTLSGNQLKLASSSQRILIIEENESGSFCFNFNSKLIPKFTWYIVIETKKRHDLKTNNDNSEDNGDDNEHFDQFNNHDIQKLSLSDYINSQMQSVNTSKENYEGKLDEMSLPKQIDSCLVFKKASFKNSG